MVILDTEFSIIIGSVGWSNKFSYYRKQIVHQLVMVNNLVAVPTCCQESEGVGKQTTAALVNGLLSYTGTRAPLRMLPPLTIKINLYANVSWTNNYNLIGRVGSRNTCSELYNLAAIMTPGNSGKTINYAFEKLMLVFLLNYVNLLCHTY